ncbi:MAG: Gfo/Idh/MocA family protein [Anaerovoracaceae bacterium]
MKIAVIGLGSMGKRRIELLKKYDSNLDLCGIDLNKERCKEVANTYKMDTYSELTDKRLKDVDCVFISTSPLSHKEIIIKALKNCCHVFTELNLLRNGYLEILKLAERNECKLFLSSTMQYRKEIEYISNVVELSNKNFNYIYHVGQYLPDWHPWESYKDNFLSKKETNGCREIFAIELPWIIKAFGEIESYEKVSGNLTDLEIDFDDFYNIIFKHKNGNRGCIIADLVSYKAVRKFECFNEKEYITWEGMPKTLNRYDKEANKDRQIELYQNITKKEGYADNIIEDAYYDEIVAFFDYVLKDIKPKYGFKEDYEVLKLIDGIEGISNKS